MLPTNFLRDHHWLERHVLDAHRHGNSVENLLERFRLQRFGRLTQAELLLVPNALWRGWHLRFFNELGRDGKIDVDDYLRFLNFFLRNLWEIDVAKATRNDWQGVFLGYLRELDLILNVNALLVLDNDGLLANYWLSRNELRWLRDQNFELVFSAWPLWHNLLEVFEILRQVIVSELGELIIFAMGTDQFGNF